MLNTFYRLHKVLPVEQRRKYMALQLLFLASALIQVAGAASLAPFIALLSSPDMIHNNTLTSELYSLLGCTSDKQFLIYFALGVMLLIVLSNGIAAISTWLMFHFTSELGFEIQGATYRSYLSKDFVFYGRNNSSHMINVLTQEIPRYVFMVLQPFLVLCSQAFIGILILLGLIYIDAALSLIAALVIGGSYLLVFKLLKERLSSHGNNLWVIGNQKLKLLSESLGGIKEIRLLGTERSYAEKLDNSNMALLRSQALIGLAGDLPRFIIETIAFCALLGLALYLLAKHGNSAEVISILSLYAMAGYKLLPAAQLIYKSMSNIKANGSAMDSFYEDALRGRTIQLPQEIENSKRIPFDGNLILKDVFYKYPESNKNALSQIDLCIPRNAITAFVGVSGAGKSTLADMLLGMIHPSSGSIFAGDIEITPKNVKEWQRNLGYVPQNIFIIDDTIAANIAFGVPTEKIDLEQVIKAARMANLSTFIDSLPERYDYHVGERGALLSGGQRQRLGIARALYHDANILVLDEATSALDNVTEAEIISTINSLKSTKTVVMIAHRLSTIKAADLVVMMENGIIIETGTFDGLQKTSIKLKQMLLLGGVE